MNLLFTTIEHSGTREVKRLMGWELANIYDWQRAQLEPHTVLFCHLHDEFMPEILKMQQQMPVFTTYRQPAAVRSSWLSRVKDMAELERQMRNYETLLKGHPYVITLGGGTNHVRGYS